MTRNDNLAVEVAAIHWAGVTPAQVRKNLADNPNWSSLDLDYLDGLAERLYVFDLAVSDVGAASILLEGATQDNEEGQAPYHEVYFDESGQQLIWSGFANELIQLSEAAGHIRFYLHYADPKAGLIFNGRRLSLPEPTPFPKWLAEVMPYEPPN